MPRDREMVICLDIDIFSYQVEPPVGRKKKTNRYMNWDLYRMPEYLGRETNPLT